MNHVDAPPTMTSRRGKNRRPSQALVLLLLTLGCGKAERTSSSVKAPVPQPAEASWNEQASRVRAGESDAIRFDRTPVTPEQWSMLATGCATLEVLEADARRLTAPDLELLAGLPGLRRLKLTGPVDDARLRAIAQLRDLTAINLPDGEFTDEGLAGLSSLAHLELLRFGSPNVTDAGLADVAKLPALRFLHLLDVPITDAGLKHLSGLDQLESFYLDGGNCTDEGLHELLKALPELHFHRDQLHLPGDPAAHPHD